jgi:hypothetical protein
MKRRIVIVSVFGTTAGAIMIRAVTVIPVIIKVPPAAVADPHSDLCFIIVLAPCIITVTVIFLFFVNKSYW